MKKTNERKKSIKEKNGITLIALVITIIVLLILAGISITMLTGSNSILNQATNARTKTIEGTEKEAIKLAYSGILANYIGEEVTAERIKTELEKNGNKIKKVEESGNKITIEFEETGNIYKIDNNGNFAEPVVNPYSPDDWVYAYTYTEANGWSNIIEAGNPAEGTIVAKFYKVGGQILTEGDQSIEIPEFHLVIEGTGDMGPVADYFVSQEGYAWLKQRQTEATTEEDAIKNLSIDFVSQVYICDGITSVGDFAFYIEKKELEFVKFNKVVIADSVTSIGNSAFSYCSDLSDITFSSSLDTIGPGAFWECASLTSISIPDSVTNIGESAFHGCSGLTSMSIPKGITEIKQGVFTGCTNLDIKIPDTVTNIERYAFNGVKHIEYHGTATGSPWGAQAIN